MFSWFFSKTRLSVIDDEISLIIKTIEDLEKRKTILIEEKDKLTATNLIIPLPPPPPLTNIDIIRRILISSKENKSDDDNNGSISPVDEFNRLYTNRKVKDVLEEIRKSRDFRKKELPPSETILYGLSAVHAQLKEKIAHMPEIIDKSDIDSFIE